MPHWLRALRTGLAIAAVGILPFVLLEAGLRAFNYGYPTGFFVPIQSSLQDKAAFTSNDKFGWRFFPASIARVPLVTYVPAGKDADTWRIFVLGDSAAMGIPEPAFGFGQILRILLESRYPGVKFEVVNTAMTAINSHVLLPIASDSARLHPDLFIVLTGNNEVVGPYGPGTVLAGYSSARSLIRAGIRFKSTRTAEWLEKGLTRFRPADEPQVWEGMAMFTGHEVSADDSRLPAVYRNFRANLEDIAGTAQRAGASTILSTVPVNLKDSAPFASTHRRDLQPDDKARWQKLYDDGVRQANAANCPAAQDSFLQAARIDDRFADLHYRLAQCLLTLGHADEARDQFLQARDLDALRFRADTQINRAIRQVAASAGASVRLADAERMFGQTNSGNSAIRIPGNDLFFEHVHLNFAGNYLLAGVILPQVEAVLPDRVRSHRREAPLPTESEAADALGFTEWDRDKSTMEMLTMMQDAPFTSQSDFPEKKAAREQTLTELREKWASPEKLAGMREHFAQYEAALQRDPENLDLRQILAELLSRGGDHAEAAKQYRALLALVPDIARWHANLGHELVEQGQLDEGRQETEAALAAEPGLTAAQFTMGTIMERSGQPLDAVPFYETALKAKPDYADAHLRLAIILGRQGRYREAADRYIAYLRLAPGSPEAENNLGFILVKLDQIPQAVPHYREALRLKPGFAEAANNLGAALQRLGKRDESIGYFRLALRLKPGFPEALRHLNEELARGK